MESLIGAVNAKADAIYLAGNRFGARAFAQNFDLDHLSKAIEYAHLRDVLVYVTVNTLIYDREIADFIAFTDALVSMGVDALIVQDLGMMNLMLKRYPKTEIHLSTQMNIDHIDQIRFFETLGVKRIVLAREVNIEQIKQWRSFTHMDFEVFIHGALCVSRSGQCLFSFFNGGRSANRGACAQPCRLPYRWNDETKEDYALSMKELMTLENISELMDSGIASFKIEGRMRRPQYVVQTVLSYRKAINHHGKQPKIDLKDDIKRLKTIFNRDFTKGFILDAEQDHKISHTFSNHQGIPLGQVVDVKGKRMVIKLTESLRVQDGYRILDEQSSGDLVSRILKNGTKVDVAYPGDIIELDLKTPTQLGSYVIKTKDSSLENELSQYLKPARIPVIGKLHVEVGHLASLMLKREDQSVTVFSKEDVRLAVDHPLTEDILKKQIDRLGETPYQLHELEIVTDGKSFIPVRELNDLRREAINQLTEQRLKKEVAIVDFQFNPISILPEPAIQCLVSNSNQFDMITSLLEKHQESVKYPCQVFQKYDARYPYKDASYPIGSLSKSHAFSSDSSWNVTNHQTVHFLHEHGFNQVMMSLETTVLEAMNTSIAYQNAYRSTPQLAYMIYGRPKVMTIESHILPHETSKDWLIGKDKNAYPVLQIGQKTFVYHHQIQSAIESADTLLQNGFAVCLDFTFETQEEIKRVMNRFFLLLQKNKEDVSC